MDPVEQELYGTISGMQDSSLKQIESAFGDEIIDDLKQSDSDSTLLSDDDDDDLRKPESSIEEVSEEKSADLKIETLLTDPAKVQEIAIKKTPTAKYKVLNQAKQYIKILKRRGIDPPEALVEIITRSKMRSAGQIQEAHDALKLILSDSETSEFITEWMLNGITMITRYFNGTRVVPFTKFKLNLNGYPQNLKRRIKDVNDQNMKVARIVNTRLGEDIIAAVKFFSVFIMPLITTILENHGSRDDSGYSELSEDDEEEDSEEEDEESDSA